MKILQVYNVRLSSPKEAASAILSQKNSRDFIDPPMGHPRDASELVFALSPGTVGFYKRASKEISVAVSFLRSLKNECNHSFTLRLRLLLLSRTSRYSISPS